MKTPLRFFGTGLTLALLLALTGLLAGCSKAGRVARHFERAEAYLQAGEREKAEIEYLNVLRLEPLHAPAIERLGEIYFEQGRFPRALVFLLKTRELDTNNIIARLRAAQSFMAVGQPKPARDEVLPVLEQQPTNETALLLLVESLRSTNELAEVEQRLAQLRPRLDNHPGLFLAQAALAMMRRDSNTAARASLEAVQRGPQSHVAHLVRGGFLLTLNDLTNALRHFETAAQLAPVRSLVPVRYAELCLQLGERARGRAVLSNLLAQASDYLPAQVQMLKLELAEGRLDECEALIRRVLASENTHFDALVARGQVLLARGKREAALKELERVVGLYPKSAPAQYAYALTLLINGDETKAASALNQALSLEPNYPDAILLRARLDMRRGDAAAAVTALTELLRQRPRLVPARLALAEAYGLRGALPEALAIYQGLAKEFPRDPQFPFLIGLILRDQQKLDEAYHSFEQALALAPDNFQALRQLVELRLLRKEYDAARQLLAGPLAKTPPTAAPLVLLALTYLAQNDLARAEENLLKAIAAEPEARPAYLMLAQVLVAGGKQQQALERLEGLLAKNPKDLPALLQVAMLRDSLDQPEQAAEAYRKLLEINPKFHPALNNLAYLYCERLGRPDEALELAKQARELAPKDPATADTLGWAAFRKGDYAWAQPLLEEAAQGLPDDPEVQYHLGLVRYMLGQEEAARAALQRAAAATRDFRGKKDAEAALAWLNLNPESLDARAADTLEKRLREAPADPVAVRRLAAFYERQGQTDRAVQLYENLLKANPKVVFALLRLAELQAGPLNNPARAIELLQQARTLDPQGALTAQQAGRVALRAGDSRWAYSLLQESLQKQPADPATRLDLALAAYHVGRLAEAEAALQQLLATNAPGLSAATVRTWLELVRATQRPELAPAALPAARVVLQSDTNALPALMVTALAAEREGQVAQARQVYESLQQRHPHFTPALRQLALLRVRVGESDAAVQTLLSRAREAFPQDPEVAAALGIVSGQRGDLARAVQLLNEAVKQRPEQVEWWFHLGMAHHRLKQPAQARPALERALQQPLKAEWVAQARQALAEMK
jgi:tetratricopeptide (TPR) repeat protein